ncbi:MAG: contact-dependent growth inhibition system immunity protein [Janthinobacterium lividum]
MFFSEGKAIYASQEASTYPHLDYLLESYFHQDFDIFGNTLAEVIAKYTEDESESERRGTISDIHRFLEQYGQTNDSLAGALERVFKPGVIIEGWEGLTSSQWLGKIARLLA